MEYMTTSDAVKKWNISERRVRQLLSEGRIEGAFKIGGIGIFLLMRKSH